MAASDSLRIGALALRSLAFGSINVTLTAVGAAATDSSRMLEITNTTNQDLIGSFYGTQDEFILPSGVAKIYDFCTNKTNVASGLYLPMGARVHVRHQGVAPTSGSVFVTYIVAE